MSEQMEFPIQCPMINAILCVPSMHVTGIGNVKKL